MEHSREIALAGLGIGAIKLNLLEPFTWASGFQMPIYNDNRMFLEYPEYRKLIARAFEHKISSENIEYDKIAGTSTAGISPATSLADLLNKPLIYVRDKLKEHGLKNQIEGIDAGKNLQEEKIILIEDLISTGGSSVKAVQAIRNAGGICEYCFSIFNYGFSEAVQAFNSLKPKCEIYSILTYGKLMEIANEMNYFNKKELEILKDWEKNPFEWAEKHGFPKLS